MKQTAVEWLIEQFKEYDFEDSPTMYIMQIPSWVLEKKELQAKEMEKQQIIEARVTAPLLDTCSKNEYIIEAEQYYNETFKTK
jgi:hypothetical protein